MSKGGWRGDRINPRHHVARAHSLAYKGKGTREVGGSPFGLAAWNAPTLVGFSAAAWSYTARSRQAASKAASGAGQSSSQAVASTQNCAADTCSADCAEPPVGAAPGPWVADVTGSSRGSAGTSRATRPGASAD